MPQKYVARFVYALISGSNIFGTHLQIFTYKDPDIFSLKFHEIEYEKS